MDLMSSKRWWALGSTFGNTEGLIEWIFRLCDTNCEEDPIVPDARKPVKQSSPHSDEAMLPGYSSFPSARRSSATADYLYARVHGARGVGTERSNPESCESRGAANYEAKSTQLHSESSHFYQNFYFIIFFNLILMLIICSLPGMLWRVE